MVQASAGLVPVSSSSCSISETLVDAALLELQSWPNEQALANIGLQHEQQVTTQDTAAGSSRYVQ